jgi:hypothetical protein
MKREQAKWLIDPELKERFNAEAHANQQRPNRVIEELMKLWLEFILPKSKEGQ